MERRSGVRASYSGEFPFVAIFNGVADGDVSSVVRSGEVAVVGQANREGFD